MQQGTKSASRTTLVTIGAVVLLATGAAAARTHSSPRGARAARGPSALEQLTRAHAQLVTEHLQPCLAQMQHALDGMAIAAMNGAFASYQPACAASMAMWTAQAAVLEKRIYQLQTGANLPVTDFAMGGPSAPSPAWTPANGDQGLGAVERYDRNAIRGTANYTDSDGEVHELPIAPYYVRDRVSGDIVPSQTGDAPADGRDWQPMQSQD